VVFLPHNFFLKCPLKEFPTQLLLLTLLMLVELQSFTNIIPTYFIMFSA
jgi:hypothetical protein